MTISEDSNVSTNTVNTVNCSDSVVLWAEKWKSDPSLSTSESNKHCLASFIIPSVRQKKRYLASIDFGTVYTGPIHMYNELRREIEAVRITIHRNVILKHRKNLQCFVTKARLTTINHTNMSAENTWSALAFDTDKCVRSCLKIRERGNGFNSSYF